METKGVSSIVQYREQLEDVIVSNDGVLKIKFTAKVIDNPDLVGIEEYHNSGAVKIEVINTGEVYDATYKLTELANDVYLYVNFWGWYIDLGSVPLPFHSGNQGSFPHKFDDTMEKLRYLDTNMMIRI